MKALVAIATCAVLALTADGCGQRADVHAKVCVASKVSTDHGTQIYKRLPDANCRAGARNARWRYYGENISIPKVGAGAASKTGSWDEPSGTLVYMPENKTRTARDVFDDK